jgi:hypothetical protein
VKLAARTPRDSKPISLIENLIRRPGCHDIVDRATDNLLIELRSKPAQAASSPQ